jgi:hypothetical protein
MAKKKASKPVSGSRTEWLDEKSESPVIGQYVERLGTFLDAMADGKIDSSELKTQEARVVALMKSVEPSLNDELHEQVTHLLCELSAYNIMHTIHDLVKEQPRTKFRG